MGKTYRTEPSSKALMKRQAHVGYRKLEETAAEVLAEYPHPKPNRITSAHSRIADPWDDRIVSDYRGQKWYRGKY
jgi:hypothetical protein